MVAFRYAGEIPPLAILKIIGSYREGGGQPRREGNRGEMEPSVAEATAALEMVLSPRGGVRISCRGQLPSDAASLPARM